MWEVMASADATSSANPTARQNDDRLVKHRSFPPLGRLATRRTFPQRNSRFYRQIRGGRRFQTTEPHGKAQLPVPMSSTFHGISWYRKEDCYDTKCSTSFPATDVRYWAINIR
jgi:hypothetical protein